MKQAQFESKRKELKKEYRAVCHSNNGHWNSTWKDTYAEAYAEADKHRKSDNNKSHSIRIIERIYNEATLD